jgi:energy-coupling factor transporter ATP-binding protein EcfA2
MISFQDVTFTYPGASYPALQSINLEIPAGSFVLVMGLSGSGKSTLLRCMNGLVPHFSGGTLSGTIRVAEMDPVDASPQVMSRKIGFVFQDPEAQFILDRVEDEVAFALENLALPPAEIRTRLDATLGLLGLTALRERRLDTLSGGERQRVALAAVMALNPSLLILDEPTSQLDPEAAETVLQTLVRLNRDLGLTILLAEHRLERVLPFVDRLIYLDSEPGRMLVGDPRQVLAEVDLVSPVVALGKYLGWQPLPLTVQEALPFAQLAQLPESSDVLISDIQATLPEPVLRIVDLHVFYGPKPILKGVNLSAQGGEVLALMGPNGAGKTTLLRSLIGLMKPEVGEILLLGESIAGKNTADLARLVGYLPQDPNALLFADRVLDELLYTLHSRAHQPHGHRQNSSADTDTSNAEKAAVMLAQMGMADLAEAYPRDLSVGQRQRVALAAIMVAQPRLLLLDEPTRGLDAAAKQRLADLLQTWRDDGHAIILVTHDVELVARLADRVAILEDGVISAQGKPVEVLAASPVFMPQVLQLFPDAGCLTPKQLINRLRST